MTIKVQFKNTDFKRVADENLNIIQRELSGLIQTELTLLKDRTEKGKDKNNVTFEDYAPSYLAANKEKRNPPNLRKTGTMSRSLFSTVKQNATAVIGEIRSTLSSRVRYNIEGDSSRNRPPRDFFGLSEEQVTRIQTKLKNLLRL